MIHIYESLQRGQKGLFHIAVYPITHYHNIMDIYLLQLLLFHRMKWVTHNTLGHPEESGLQYFCHLGFSKREWRGVGVDKAG